MPETIYSKAGADTAISDAITALGLTPAALSGSRTRTVSATGLAQYTTIQAAVDASTEGDLIDIWPGTYREQVSAWGKPNIHLRGRDKRTVILIDSSGAYSTPPLEIGSGSVSNMTIIEDHAAAGTTSANFEDQRAYCIHADNAPSMAGKTLVLEDLVMTNARRPCVGMGTYQGTTVTMRRCEMRSGAPTLSNDRNRGALYFHNLSSSNGATDDQHVIIEDCLISCDDLKALYVYDSSLTPGNKPSTLDVRINNSTVWSKLNGVTGIIGGDGITGQVFLHPASYGNNVAELNASAATLDAIAGTPAYQGNADVTFGTGLDLAQPLTLYAAYTSPTAASGVVLRQTSLAGTEILSSRRNGAGTAFVAVGTNASGVPTVTTGTTPIVSCSTTNGSTLRLHVRGVGEATASISAWPSGTGFGVDVQTGVSWFILYVGAAHPPVIRDAIMRWLAANKL